MALEGGRRPEPKLHIDLTGDPQEANREIDQEALARRRAAAPTEIVLGERIAPSREHVVHVLADFVCLRRAIQRRLRSTSVMPDDAKPLFLVLNPRFPTEPLTQRQALLLNNAVWFWCRRWRIKRKRCGCYALDLALSDPEVRNERVLQLPNRAVKESGDELCV